MYNRDVRETGSTLSRTAGINTSTKQIASEANEWNSGGVMMQDWMTWVFDGIGSTIFSLIAGALIGGAAGYQQKQTGGNNIKQRQEFTLENEDVSEAGGKIKNNFQQSQKAGDNAEQVQIGGIKRGR